MATRYGGIGDTSMENPESQDVDSDSQENYQEENIVSLPTLNSQNGAIETICRGQETKTPGMPYNSWNKSLIN